jgi:hypothetical protein
MEVSDGAPAPESASAPTEGTPNESAEGAEHHETPAQQEARRKYRLKVEGQEIEVDEDELKKGYSHSRAASMRMQEATELKKQAAAERQQYNELLTQFEQDPWKLFELLKKDPDTAAEERLLRKLEYESMTPQQRALYEKERSLTAKERDLKEFEELKRKHEEALAEQEQEALTYKAVQQIDNEIGAAFDATGTKPTPRTVARVAEIMLAHLDSEDGERLDAGKALGIFQNEMKGEIGTYLSSLNAEQLIQALPKESLDAIRKHFLNEARGTDPLRHGAPASKSSTRPTKNARMSTDSFFDNLQKKLK